jgi:hypothetical protein
MDTIYTNDPNLRQWLSTASPADVELALQVGWRNVSYVNDTAPRQQIPVHRGQIGEDIVERVLRERFADLTVVTKSAMCGDITLWTSAGKTIVEVKNYTRPVPTTEVDKFRRDLSTTGATSGVFISLKAPISLITGDFKIVLESVDGRTVPCGYIVSDSQQQILTAVNIVMQYHTAISSIRKELCSKDLANGLIKELSDGINDLSGVRTLLQKNLNDVSNKLMATAVNVMSAEGKLRGCLAKLNDEFATPAVTTQEAIYGLDGVAAYAKYEPGYKVLVERLMTAVQSSTSGEIVCGWKTTAKKCTHSNTGIALTFGKTAQVEIPPGCFPVESVGVLYRAIGKKFIFNGGLVVDIADDTIAIIERIITGVDITCVDSTRVDITCVDITPGESRN